MKHHQDFLQKFKLDRDNTLLLVIDIQDRLAKAMFNKDEVIANTKKLVQFADIFSIPTLFTEQNPNSLGNTNDELKSLAKKSDVMPKMEFSVVLPKFEEILNLHSKKNIIVTGIETHVCVYQSIRDLLMKGYNVTLVNDATGSRAEKNYKNGLELISKMGAVISNTESIIFDILQTSTDPDFKKAQALIK